MLKFCLFLLLACPLFGDEEELLFARRINECWKDKECDLTKSQIELFLSLYPSSSYVDSFYVILGDMALQAKSFKEALAYYDKVGDLDIVRQTRSKRWYALYQLQDFRNLQIEIEPHLPFLEDDDSIFYLAEATFRQAIDTSRPMDESSQTALLHEALPLYQRLQFNPRFSDHALLALGEIHKRLGQYNEAADAYQRVAEMQKSQLALFQCAMMMAKCNEEKAIDLFSRIVKTGGKNASEASYQWLMLLARAQRFEEITKSRKYFLDTLAPGHLAVYYYYEGMYHASQKQWEPASDLLSKSLELGLKPPHDKGALLSLMLAAKELGSIKAADMAFELLKDRYPSEYEEAAFLRAVTYRKNNRNQIALSLFTELISLAEKPEILEEAYLEKTHLLMSEQNWEKAHDLALHYLKKFPASAHRSQMIRLAIDLSLAGLHNEEGYEKLMVDLETALDAPGVFSKEEEPKQHLLLAKCYLKLEKPTSARFLLEDLIEQSAPTAELHYLMALALLREGGGPESLIVHGEKALELEPTFAEADRLHLYLFNAYLRLSKLSNDEKISLRAADHLYAVVDRLSISLENQLWLAHTYAKNESSRAKAIHILEGLLQTTDAITRLCGESLLLASLYDEEDNLEMAYSLLTTLHENATSPGCCLSLGKIYREKGFYLKAAELLSPLEKNPDPAIALGARLENARVALLANENTNIAMRTLKELWLQKTLQHEPIHLEAALDYAEAAPFDKRLKIYDAIKENFIAQTDICSKDYHEQRLCCPEKDRLYQAYMRFIDVKVLLTLAEIEAKAHIDNSAKIAKAKAQLKSLTEGNYTLTKYLKTAIDRLEIGN